MMLWKLRLALGLVLGCWAVSSPAYGENWPCWRGPRGDGTSLESGVPRSWNGLTGANIRWRTPVPGSGHASPIVWNDRVFLVGCVEATQERVLACLDRLTGKTLWQQAVVRAPLETKHALNSFASSTPATDGKLVYVSFLEVDGHTIPAPNVGAPRPITPGQMVVAAYDFAGNQRWLARPGEFISAHGYCASPVLFENLVILNGDHDGDSYVVALDKTTGKTVWSIPREHKTRSYVTPIIREIGGRTQMVFSGSLSIVSLDPRTGSLLWHIAGPTEQFVASMVTDGKLLFMAAGFPTYHVMAIRPDGSGNVTNTHVAWHETNAKCYVPSPVVVNGHLIVADDRGTANCFVAESGQRLWQERLGTHFSASLVTAGELVYAIADDGQTKVVRPGPLLEVVADNPLGENCYSSPAIAHGSLFIRGEKHLYCVATDEAAGR
jgi:outer membrane protein assembly factor BamB